MDEPIVITSTDLVDHTVFNRKRTETMFRRDFLLRNGASAQDTHVSALGTILGEIDEKLKPIEEKIKVVDLITVVPSKGEITALSERINQHGREQLDEAVRQKSGPVYELMRQRAEITRKNYEHKEEIARLTIMLNMLQRKEAQNLKAVVESNLSQNITIDALNAEQQQELATLLGRLGIAAYVADNTLSTDKKKFEGSPYVSSLEEVEKNIRVQGTELKAWVLKERLGEWEENEQHISAVTRKIQLFMAKKQAGELSEEEAKEFDAMQTLYLELKGRRMSLANIKPPAYVSLPRASIHHAPVGEVERMDLGPQAPGG